MEEALWEYRTTYRTPTEETPYSLAFGIEAVLPLERQIPSLRLSIQEGLTGEENVLLRLAELEALDQKRIEPQQNLECYQARLSRAFNKKVVQEDYSNGAYKFVDAGGLRISPINAEFLKSYYP
ncbi:hypothetical protein EJD97_022726 [Solanum chilense]|uniref:Uncharacterized protein n=1 Tax=Solanum chilense TaxID=4083 RepID=A0A6N2AVA7_SOLCI|nr:hypothetical protein EJD97_022726 [Solanum chilense]